MPVLLCAATPFELEPTLRLLSDRKEKEEVDVLVTGVGLMASTYNLARQLATRRYSLVIGAGICGSLHPHIRPGMTVVVEKEMVGDSGVLENGSFRSLFDLGLIDRSGHPWRDGWLPNEASFLRSFGLPLAQGVTVNEITTGPERIRTYASLGAEVESLEGAGLHYACLMEQVPFLQLRSVSNEVGERDKQKWLLRPSIEALNRELQRILTQKNLL